MVAKYVSLAAAGELDWATAAGLGEAELERRLLGRSAEDSRVVEPDFGRIHVELRRKGVTLTLLWQEYRAVHEGERTWGLTQFSPPDLVDHQQLRADHRPIEVLLEPALAAGGRQLQHQVGCGNEPDMPAITAR